MQVKLFWKQSPVRFGLFKSNDDNAISLENEINAWLREHPHIKIADIRQSAKEALVKIGPAAVPALTELLKDKIVTFDTLVAIAFAVATGIGFRNGIGRLFRRACIVTRILIRRARNWRCDDGSY